MSVTVTCMNCQKEFIGVSQRAQFCSGACKTQFHRNKKKGATVTSTSVHVTENTAKHPTEITVTDQQFIDDYDQRYADDSPAGLSGKDWYVFDNETFGRKCWQCKEEFTTRLKLNRYCSPDCRDEALRA